MAAKKKPKPDAPNATPNATRSALDVDTNRWETDDKLRGHRHRLGEDAVARVARAAWRGETGAGTHEDVAGFCS